MKKRIIILSILFLTALITLVSLVIVRNLRAPEIDTDQKEEVIEEETKQVSNIPDHLSHEHDITEIVDYDNVEEITSELFTNTDTDVVDVIDVSELRQRTKDDLCGDIYDCDVEEKILALPNIKELVKRNNECLIFFADKENEQSFCYEKYEGYEERGGESFRLSAVYDKYVVLEQTGYESYDYRLVEIQEPYGIVNIGTSFSISPDNQYILTDYFYYGEDDLRLRHMESDEQVFEHAYGLWEIKRVQWLDESVQLELSNTHSVRHPETPSLRYIEISY